MYTVGRAVFPYIVGRCRFSQFARNLPKHNIKWLCETFGVLCLRKKKKCLRTFIYIYINIHRCIQTEESSRPSEFKNIGIPLSKRGFFLKIFFRRQVCRIPILYTYTTNAFNVWFTVKLICFLVTIFVLIYFLHTKPFFQNAFALAGLMFSTKD